MRHSLAALMMVALCCAHSPVRAGDDGLHVAQARTAEPLPGVSMMAGYFTVANEGTRSVTLVGASSPDVDRIELHRSVVEDGQARMEPVDSIAVPAGERVRFEPGGLHLMMFGPHGHPHKGDSIAVVLHTDGGPIDFRMPLVDRAALLEQSR